VPLAHRISYVHWHISYVRISYFVERKVGDWHIGDALKKVGNVYIGDFVERISYVPDFVLCAREYIGDLLCTQEISYVPDFVERISYVPDCVLCARVHRRSYVPE